MGRGGARKGAGRPAGRGPHGEATRPMRVPLSLVDSVTEFLAKKGYKIPLYMSHVQAGDLTSTDDALEDRVDLNSYLIGNPTDTFLVRAAGESMIGANIFQGDTLIVDRSIKPANGKIVVAAVDGQITVKRFNKDKGGTVSLLPENPDFSPIVLMEGNELTILGVVTNVIHQL